jgi:hypothetical protein
MEPLEPTTGGPERPDRPMSPARIRGSLLGPLLAIALMVLMAVALVTAMIWPYVPGPLN